MLGPFATRRSVIVLFAVPLSLSLFPLSRVVALFAVSTPPTLSQFAHFPTQLLELFSQFLDSLVQFGRLWMAFSTVRISSFSTSWTFMVRSVFRTTPFFTSSVFFVRITVASLDPLANLPGALPHQLGQIAHPRFSQQPGRLHDLFDRS